ncbi:MAG: polysaccharide biosynthesis tyrosine autokinase [Flavobacteriaceae bacterium]|nr:polysaccharide biosynthesis tyrosine autokinase [Flavobacteriaceae bacterium]
MNQEYNSHRIERDDTINIREEIEKYLIHWKWFVLGVFLAIVGAFLYLRYTTPQYAVKTAILIKDDKKGGVSTEIETFKDLGILGGSNQNVDNEIEIIKSRSIIGKALKNLKLNINYITSGRIKESEVYKKSPILVDFMNADSLLYDVDTTFTILIKDATTFQLASKDREVKETHQLGATINSGIGKFQVQLNTKQILENNTEVKVVISPLNRLIDSYKKKVNVAPVNKNSSVVNLTLNDAVKERAEDFLNELVAAYNEDAILDKNQVSKKTKEFIQERLDTIGVDLSSVNNQLKDFKTKNKLTNVEAESELTIKILSENNTKIIETSTRLHLVKALSENLINAKENKEDYLPTNLVPEDLSITQSIVQYNELIGKKKDLLQTATEINPSVKAITKQITGVKSSLIKSLQTSKKSLELTLKRLELEDAKIKSKIKGVPLQELQLHDIKLQQEITRGLYSYLLKKKEETDISLAVTVANAKIIDEAYGSDIPVSPKRKIIYLAALLLGLLLPFVILYVRNLLDTKIHNKSELQKEVSIPFLGDVPRSDSKEKIVIGADARSSTAESFRLIRTNLDFMLTNHTSKNKTIFITSTTSGEGKSFISINVAASLALSGKKVLLMGLDLRAPKITEYLGLPDKKGVTNYITDTKLDYKDLIFNIEDVKNLDIISSGVVPPNPAELLMTKRTEELFTSVKETYDYVVVDTAPVNLVTDTLLLAKYADMFMYVVRANYLDKRLLTIPQTLYKEKKLPNIAMVLNDTDPKRTYGYGYGYGYVLDERPWYKKIFS